MFKVGEKVIFVYDPINEGSFYVERQLTMHGFNNSVIYKGYNLSKSEGGRVIHFGVNENTLKLDIEYYRIQKLKKICSRLEKK